MSASDNSFSDGRPLPPVDLIMTVSGTGGDPEWFSRVGRCDAEKFAQLASRHGVDLERGLSVLDFGCGAGRIARWLAPTILAHGGVFAGRDVNKALVDWCGANLEGDYRRNQLNPPLDVAGGSLDLIYAHSVLTHLREQTAVAWLEEIHRVLKPGGLAILTFHDENYAAGWASPEIRAELEKRAYVVWNNSLEGSNYMSAWTTRAYFGSLADRWFDVLEIVPGGLDSPDQAIGVLGARK